MKNQVIAGWRIDAERERIQSVSSEFYTGNTPALVKVHRIGDVPSWLTPAEARALAAMLIEAAKFAAVRRCPSCEFVYSHTSIYTVDQAAAAEREKCASLVESKAKEWRAKSEKARRNGDADRETEYGWGASYADALATAIRHHAAQATDVAPPRQRVPIPDIATHPCHGCGVRHSLKEFPVHARVVAYGKTGTVVEWSQYGGPLWIRVEHDEIDSGTGEKRRRNYNPCDLTHAAQATRDAT